jgi:hypothetical protein
MNFGVDFLGGARYQRTCIDNQPRSFGFGVFAEVEGFGKAYDLIDKIASLGVPFIRAHLIWKDKHDFNASDLPACKARMAKLLPIIKKYPSVKWYVSPVCEHRLKEKEWLKFADIVASMAGGLVSLINSPENGKGFVSREYINEYHHEKKPRAGGKFAFSFDGANAVDSDVESLKAAYQGSEYFMLWNCQCNGRRTLDDKTPRAARKFWPVPKQIDSWVFLTRYRGDVRYPSRFIGKSHSDQHKVPPSDKDQKPVHISPMDIDPDRLYLKANNGQTIATSTKKKPYNKKNPDGSIGKQIGWRYYFDSDWGFELSQKAMRIHASPVCNFFGDNKKLGTVNPAYRAGVFRD